MVAISAATASASCPGCTETLTSAMSPKMVRTKVTRSESSPLCSATEKVATKATIAITVVSISECPGRCRVRLRPRARSRGPVRRCNGSTLCRKEWVAVPVRNASTGQIRRIRPADSHADSTTTASTTRTGSAVAAASKPGFQRSPVWAVSACASQGRVR